MKLTELETQFEPVAKIVGGVFLLSEGDALRFIDECERHRISIEGIEGFKIHGERIQPLQEHSLDLEGIREGNYQIARQFILDRLSSHLWFEVVTSDRQG